MFPLTRRAVLSASLGAAVIGHASRGRAQSPERVRFLVPIRNVDESYAPAVVAREVGFFREEGLAVELLPVGGSNEVAMQIGAGNGDIGAASPGQAVVGMQPQIGLDVRYFYDILYSNIWMVSVSADSQVTDLGGLRGKKLGVTAMGSAGITFGRAYVRAAGLDPQRDVVFMPVGAGAQVAAAVRAKMVDGIVFWDSAIAKLESNGLALRHLPLPHEVSALPDVSLLAKPATLHSRPRAVVGTARGLAKGYDFCVANPEAAVRIVWKAHPESRPANLPPEQAMRDAVRAMQARLANWDSLETGGKHGLFMEQDWRNLVAFMQAQGLLAAPVPTTRIYTNEFIEQINAYDRAAVTAAAKSYAP